MKKVIILLIVTLILNCTKASQTKYSTDSEEVFLIITQNTTEAELITIATEFKSKKNIDINFSKSQFLQNGKLKVLSLFVNCNDGFEGTATSSDVLLKSKNSGFSRDYKDNSIDPFVIGAM